MQVAITGATGFLGRYIVNHLIESGHTCRCWQRPQSDRGGFDGIEAKIQWLPGDLNDESSMRDLVAGVDAVVHAALDRPTRRFRGAEGDLPTFVDRNVLGTIRLIEAARTAGAERFIFISTCAVHEVILGDRKLDRVLPRKARFVQSRSRAHPGISKDLLHQVHAIDGLDGPAGSTAHPHPSAADLVVVNRVIRAAITTFDPHNCSTCDVCQLPELTRTHFQNRVCRFAPLPPNWDASTQILV